MADKKDIQLRIDTTINAANTETDLRRLRGLMRELSSLGEEIGDTTSESFKKVSQTLSEVEGKIGDASDRFKTLTGEPLERVNNGLSLVSEGLTNLDFGKATIGINGIADGISKLKFADMKKGIGDVATAFFNLGKALLTNPLFLLGSAIVLIITNFKELTKMGGVVGDVFRAIGDIVKDLTKWFKDFTDGLGLTNFALEETGNQAVASAEMMSKFTAEITKTAKELNQIKGISTFLLDWQQSQAELNATLAEFNLEQSKYINSNTKVIDIMTQLKNQANELATSLKNSNGELIDGEKYTAKQNAIMQQFIKLTGETITNEEDLKRVREIGSKFLSQSVNQAATIYIEEQKQRTEINKKRLQQELEKAKLIEDVALRERKVLEINRKLKLADAELDKKLKTSGAEQLIKASNLINAQYSKNEQTTKQLRKTQIDDTKQYYNQLINIVDKYVESANTGNGMQISDLVEMNKILKQNGIETVRLFEYIGTGLKNMPKRAQSIKDQLKESMQRKLIEIENIKDEDLYQKEILKIQTDGQKLSKDAQQLYYNDVKNINLEFQRDTKNLTLKEQKDLNDRQIALNAANQKLMLESNTLIWNEKEDRLKTYHNREIELMRRQYDILIQESKGDKQKQADLEEEYQLKLIESNKNYYDTIGKLQEQSGKNILKNVQNTILEINGLIQQSTQQWFDKMSQLDQIRLNDTETARGIELSNLQSDWDEKGKLMIKKELEAIDKLRIASDENREYNRKKELYAVEKGSEEEKAIKDKYAATEVADTQRYEKTKLDSKMKAVDRGLMYAQGAINVINSIMEISANADEQRVKNKQMTDAEAKKRGFRRQKASSLLNAAMSTAEGIAKGVAMGPPGIPYIAIASAIGAAQIAAIASKKYNPEDESSGGVAAGSTNVTAPTMAEPAKNPFFSQSYMASSYNGSNMFGFRPSNPNQMLRVGVYEGDIRNTMNKVSVIESRSTLSGTY